MAEIVFFHFFTTGTGPLYRMDPRFKLLCLVLLSSAVLGARLPGLLLLAGGAVLLCLTVRFPFLRLLRELRPFLFLILFIVLVRSISTPGHPLAGLGGLSLSREGLALGLLAGGRILTIVLFSSLLVSTTSIEQLRSAVEWVIRPVPFLPETRIATMFALTLGFLPLILDEAADISLAQRARCIEGRRNPVYRLLVFVLALLRRTFKRADGVAMAMEARCFTGRATPCALKSRSLDWISLALAAGLTAAVILPGL